MSIIYNKSSDKLILVKQFRPSVYATILHKNPSKRIPSNSDGDIGITLELCAGIVDKKDKTPWIPEMGRVKRIHFVGIGGAGMSGIAEVLFEQGYEISGSDLVETNTTRRLEKIGIRVSYLHDKKVIEGADVVVVSFDKAGLSTSLQSSLLPRMKKTAKKFSVLLGLC